MKPGVRPEGKKDRGALGGILLVLLLALLPVFAWPAQAQDDADFDAVPVETRIGVLALRGKERALRQWQATADYLSGAVAEHRFVVVPLDFDELEPAVAGQEVDFILANSRYYVVLEQRHRVSRIATLRNRSPAGPIGCFGGVIFTLAANPQLTGIKDLAGRTLAAVDSRSLGGYLATLGELTRHGVASSDLAEVRFLGTHDAVVYAVLAGEVDAGTVRSDTLERMAQEGRLDLAQVRVLSPVHDPSFPFLHSTPLYPEWPFAALLHVPNALRSRVAIALLGMAPDSPAAVAGLNEGWSVPANYQPVHELLRQLRLPPYEPEPPPPMLEELYTNHKDMLVALVVVLAGLLLHLVRLRSWNRSLLATQQQLRASQVEKDKSHTRLQAAYASLAAKEDLLDKVTDTALDGILMLDDEGRVAYANTAAAQMLGYTEEELFGLDLHECIVAPELRAQARAGFAAFVRSGAGRVVGATLTVEAMRKDGSRLPVELSVSALRMHERWHAIGVVRDIAARLHMEATLAERTERFRTLVDENRTGILVLDAQGVIRFANPAAERLLSAAAAELEGRAFGGPIATDRQSEIPILRDDGTPGVAEVSVTETVWKGEHARLAMLHDVTERKVREETMRHLAFRDGLTNLPNRSLFRLRLEQMIHLARREGKGFAVLFLDLDRFKEVNDTHGHAVGDLLLQQVAERLGHRFRESDTVARLAGDEFTAVAYDTPTRDAAARVAQRALDLFERPFRLETLELAVRASIGVSLFPLSGEDPDTLLRQADSAMYDAKRRGNAGFSIYAPHMSPTAPSRTELEGALREALRRGELTLLYQAQVRVRDRLPIGVEALLRWHHPRKGLLVPGDFLALLEDTGLILDAGRWVLAEACRQIRHWQEGGRRVPVAVNISHVQLERGDLLSEVREALEGEGIAPALLGLELTETAMSRNVGYSADVVDALARLGVRLNIDDFGAGYTSLDLVTRLPFSAVKLAPAVVRNLLSDPGSLAMAQATVAMAHGIGRTAIATGVETPAQLEQLAVLGCDAAQGYLLGRPAPPDDLVWPEAGQSG